MIIPLYKPLGASTHNLAKKFGELEGEKATHTGTLDPMAEGVVVVLTGENRFNKEEYSSVKKTYEFKILFGVSTDSHDLLGLIANSASINKASLENMLEKAVSSFRGKQKQLLPNFSAKRHQGKSYFDAAKKGESIPESYQEIEVFSINITETQSISNEKLQKEILSRISLVQGDFRQEEIIGNWKNFLETTTQKQFLIATLTATTSKRTYIRGLVRDLSHKLATPATTFNIIRTANGPYTIQDCLCLI